MASCSSVYILVVWNVLSKIIVRRSVFINNKKTEIGETCALIFGIFFYRILIINYSNFCVINRYRYVSIIRLIHYTQTLNLSDEKNTDLLDRKIW